MSGSVGLISQLQKIDEMAFQLPNYPGDNEGLFVFSKTNKSHKCTKGNDNRHCL